MDAGVGGGDPKSRPKRAAWRGPKPWNGNGSSREQKRRDDKQLEKALKQGHVVLLGRRRHSNVLPSPSKPSFENNEPSATSIRQPEQQLRQKEHHGSIERNVTTPTAISSSSSSFEGRGIGQWSRRINVKALDEHKGISTLCPICGASMPPSKLRSHVNHCLDHQERESSVASSQDLSSIISIPPSTYSSSNGRHRRLPHRQQQQRRNSSSLASSSAAAAGAASPPSTYVPPWRRRREQRYLNKAAAAAAGPSSSSSCFGSGRKIGQLDFDSVLAVSSKTLEERREGERRRRRLQREQQQEEEEGVPRSSGNQHHHRHHHNGRRMGLGRGGSVDGLLWEAPTLEEKAKFVLLIEQQARDDAEREREEQERENNQEARKNQLSQRPKYYHPPPKGSVGGGQECGVDAAAAMMAAAFYDNDPNSTTTNNTSSSMGYVVLRNRRDLEQGLKALLGSSSSTCNGDSKNSSSRLEGARITGTTSSSDEEAAKIAAAIASSTAHTATATASFSMASLFPPKSSSERALMAAVLKADVKAVESFLLPRRPIRTLRQALSLHVACLLGYADITRRLAKRHIFSLAAKDSRGKTALHIACIFGRSECTKALLEAKAPAHVKDSRTYNTPLHCAAQVNATGCIKTLVEAKASLEWTNKKGHTPLHTACIAQSSDAVQCILKLRRRSRMMGHESSKKKMMMMMNHNKPSSFSSSSSSSSSTQADGPSGSVEAAFSSLSSKQRQKREGETAILLALEHGSLECAKILIEEDGAVMDARCAAICRNTMRSIMRSWRSEAEEVEAKYAYFPSRPIFRPQEQRQQHNKYGIKNSSFYYCSRGGAGKIAAKENENNNNSNNNIPLYDTSDDLPATTREAMALLPPSLVSINMWNLLANQELCDVWFRLKNDRYVGAHKIVLAARSEYFRSLFNGHIGRGRRRSREEKEVVHSLNFVSVESFSALLVYLYTGRTPQCTTSTATSSSSSSSSSSRRGNFELDDRKKAVSSSSSSSSSSFEQLVEVLVYSNMLMLWPLRDFAEKELTSQYLDKHNARHLLNIASFHNADKLAAAANITLLLSAPTDDDFNSDGGWHCYDDDSSNSAIITTTTNTTTTSSIDRYQSDHEDSLLSVYVEKEEEDKTNQNEKHLRYDRDKILKSFPAQDHLHFSEFDCPQTERTTSGNVDDGVSLSSSTTSPSIACSSSSSSSSSSIEINTSLHTLCSSSGSKEGGEDVCFQLLLCEVDGKEKRGSGNNKKKNNSNNEKEKKRNKGLPLDKKKVPNSSVEDDDRRDGEEEHLDTLSSSSTPTTAAATSTTHYGTLLAHSAIIAAGWPEFKKFFLKIKERSQAHSTPTKHTDDYSKKSNANAAKEKGGQSPFHSLRKTARGKGSFSLSPSSSSSSSSSSSQSIMVIHIVGCEYELKAFSMFVRMLYAPQREIALIMRLERKKQDLDDNGQQHPGERVLEEHLPESRKELLSLLLLLRSSYLHFTQNYFASYMEKVRQKVVGGTGEGGGRRKGTKSTNSITITGKGVSRAIERILASSEYFINAVTVVIALQVIRAKECPYLYRACTSFVVQHLDEIATVLSPSPKMQIAMMEKHRTTASTPVTNNESQGGNEHIRQSVIKRSETKDGCEADMIDALPATSARNTATNKAAARLKSLDDDDENKAMAPLRCRPTSDDIMMTSKIRYVETKREKMSNKCQDPHLTIRIYSPPIRKLQTIISDSSSSSLNPASSRPSFSRYGTTMSKLLVSTLDAFPCMHNEQ